MESITSWEDVRMPARRETAFSKTPQKAGWLSPTNPSDNAAALIRGMIFSGALGPGDWLPPGRELAAHFGISVLTLRVALKSLESTGYIATSRGHQGGSRVTDIEALTRCWLDWWRDKASEVDDMWAFREIIETKTAAFAATRRTQPELDAIEAAVRSSSEDDYASMLRSNDAFHDALASAAHSDRLAKAMVATRQELFLPAGLLLRKRRAAELLEAHTQVFEAVRERDPERAAERMSSHLAWTRTVVGTVLEEARAAANSHL
jgi:DNA-binding FadR family transcriptional regulator